MRIGPLPLALVVLGIFLPILNLGFPDRKLKSHYLDPEPSLYVYLDFRILPKEFSEFSYDYINSAEATQKTSQLKEIEPVKQLSQPKELITSKDINPAKELKPMQEILPLQAKAKPKNYLAGSNLGQVFKNKDNSYQIMIPRNEIKNISGLREEQDYIRVNIKKQNSSKDYQFLVGLSENLWVLPLNDDFPTLPLEIEWIDKIDNIGFRIQGLESTGYLPEFTFVMGSND